MIVITCTLALRYLPLISEPNNHILSVTSKMLPSRLFRNTGLPPKFRSLITPGPSLPPTVSVQLRLRLGVLRSTLQREYSTNPSDATTTDPVPLNATPPESSSAPQSQGLTSSQPLPEKLEPKLSMTFTCTVEKCGERSTHQFTKRAYERGIVLVQCPGCKNRYAKPSHSLDVLTHELSRHLIADHLGWFKDSTNGGQLRTVEDILREKGEKVRRGRIDANGDIEYVDA